MSAEKGFTVFVTILLLGLMLQSKTIHAKSYTVGDSSGWTFNIAGWEKGKTFKVGDTLVFKYMPGSHSVVAVHKKSYKSCNVPANASRYTTGNDKITLKRKGQNTSFVEFLAIASLGCILLFMLLS